MDDFPAQIADFLESTAAKIRSLTVDRVRDAATWTAVGVLVAMLGLLIAIFISAALFRLLSEITTVEIAYIIIGGLFLILGTFLWSKRIPAADQRAGEVGRDVNG